nr:hypothetical protein [Dinophyceae sp. MRD-151]
MQDNNGNHNTKLNNYIRKNEVNIIRSQLYATLIQNYTPTKILENGANISYFGISSFLKPIRPSIALDEILSTFFKTFKFMFS